MPQTCTVTGTITAPDGTAIAGAVVAFIPAPIAARPRPPAVVVPQAVEVVANSSGVITADLTTGTYSVRVRDAIKFFPGFLVVVPDAETALLENIVFHLDPPQTVYDAAASARRAANAAAASERAGAGMIFADGEGTFPGSLRAFFHPGTFIGDTTAAVTIGGVVYQIPVTQLEVPA